MAVCASRLRRASRTCWAAKIAAAKAPSAPIASIEVAIAVTSPQSVAMIISWDRPSGSLSLLRSRPDEDLVDVDVRRLFEREHHRAGDVLGLQGPGGTVLEERRVDQP